MNKESLFPKMVFPNDYQPLITKYEEDLGYTNPSSIELPMSSYATNNSFNNAHQQITETYVPYHHGNQVQQSM